jgi:hypothetical protein
MAIFRSGSRAVTLLFCCSCVAAVAVKPVLSINAAMLLALLRAGVSFMDLNVFKMSDGSQNPTELYCILPNSGIQSGAVYAVR